MAAVYMYIPLGVPTTIIHLDKGASANKLADIANCDLIDDFRLY